MIPTMLNEPLIDGHAVFYNCPKGCSWTHAVAVDPGPVRSITVSSDMSPEEITKAITRAVAARDKERCEDIERTVLTHVLRAHLGAPDWTDKSYVPEGHKCFQKLSWEDDDE